MAKPKQQNPEKLSFSYFFPTGSTDHIWSDEAAAATPELNRGKFTAMAQAAEQAGFDSMFIADTWSGHQRAAERAGHQSPKHHAPLLAMALFAVTEHIGVISTMHTAHHKPAHVARMGATLDAYSGGRWGWNVVTGFGGPEARLFGDERMVEHDERYRMAMEFVNIVKLFWQEDEPIDFNGTYYSAHGRLKAPRAAQQPHPLLVSAGSSPAGMRLAVTHCDQLVIAGNSIDKIHDVEHRLLPLLEASGRAGEVTTSPFTIAIVREGDGEAEEEYERLTRSLNVEATMELAADIIGDIESIRALFADQGFEQAAQQWGSGRAIYKLFGNAEQVASQLIDLHDQTTTRNVLVNFPLWNPDEVRNFRPVLEHLRDAGVWERPEEKDYSW